MRFGNNNMNMQQMMKQAQEMQKQMGKIKEELAETVIEASSGGGMVTVEMTAAYELINIKIKPEAKGALKDCTETAKLIAKCAEELGTAGRVLVRESGTEPLVRVMTEGKDFAVIKKLAETLAENISENFGVQSVRL